MANTTETVSGTFCPLTSMQEGMLFHSLCAPHDGFEIEQIVGDLQERIDSALFRQAWDSVVARHPVLRTSFHWEGHAHPVQQVHERVILPWAEQDWRELNPEERETTFDAFLQADRVRGFKATDAPLSRVTLFRMGTASFRVVWTLHHALLDGRSFAIVLREVFAIYEHLKAGETVQPPRVPDYRAHLQWFGRQNFKQSEPFWRKRLEGFSAATPLMVDRRGTRTSSSGRNGSHELLVSREATSALQTFAATHELTMNTLIQGAWSLLLNRYSGEPDVVFGATRACRRSSVEGAESMVGLFINTVPVRVKLDPKASLLPWLKQLRTDWQTLREHEHTPLVQVQAWSEVPASMPLFESLVVYEHQSLNEILRSEGGAWINREFRLLEQPNFPLTLAAYGGERLCLKVLFDRNRFEETTVGRLLGHLQTLLQAIPGGAQQAIGALPLVTSDERQQLLFDWNEPRVQLPVKECLHERFEAQVERTPNAVALVSEDKQWTYSELNQWADAIAAQLAKHEIRTDELIPLCMERSPEMVAAVLGILKAGGAYLPIETNCPPERTAFMLADSRARMVVTQRSLAERFKDLSVVLADEAREPAKAVSVKRRGNPACPDNLAYVIYTSGSTGQPKGVMVTHRNVVRLFEATDAWFHFSDRDVWTLFHSIAFDFSVWELWGALLYGGRLVLVPHLVARSPEVFCELLAREQVTVLNQTPSAFRQFIEAEARASYRLSLRLIIFGGEALDMSSLKPWFERHGDQQPQLVNMYGITETTVHVTYRPLTKSDAERGSVIGVPIPDLQIYILDEQREPAPIGVPGEIYVGGAGLARGYLNRPELTAERFIKSPFAADSDERLYRTGDRGRFLPGHDIEYLGRADDQVKIRGFRIEPGEIAAVIEEHNAVRQAVVIAREDQPGDRRLVAYIVPKAKAAPSVDDVRAFVKERLPDYMIPSAVVVVNNLPLTANGKLDRRALPAPGLDRAPGRKAFAAPSTDLERTIVGIWKELLAVEQVSLDDNFFEIGGHSLLLVQLHYRLQSALGRRVPIIGLFQHPTVSALAKYLGESAAPAAARPAQDRARRMRELQETVA